MSDFKTVVEYLGFDPEKVKTIDELKASFEPEFVRVSALKERKDLIDPMIGKRMGTIQTELKRMAKEYAIDFESDEFKGKQVEEQTKLLVHKMAENNLKVVNEFKAKEGQNSDAATKEWKEKYENEVKLRGEKESLLTETVGKYKDLETSSVNQLKEYKMSTIKGDLWGQIKFKAGISEIEKKGFEAHIKDNFKFELGENDKFEIRDKDGKPISNPKVTGSYREPLDVLQEEAVKANLFQLNQQGGQPAQRQQAPQQGPTQQAAKEVFINPRAQRI